MRTIVRIGKHASRENLLLSTGQIFLTACVTLAHGEHILRWPTKWLVFTGQIVQKVKKLC